MLVLGTAQDGGLPQLGCGRACCTTARSDPARRRFVSSVLLVDPRSGRRWLFDATPDLPEQVELAHAHGGPRPGAAGRPALFDGIFLTHAHTGHYTGLVHLGREAYASATVPLYTSPRMASFLAADGPWSLLVEDRHVALERFEPGLAIPLAPDLTVTPIAVPHRDEFSDTHAFRITGPGGSLLFLPDIDKWKRWERPIEAELAGVDVALLDGTFFDDSELSGRDMASIPHPFVVESIARFEGLPAAERAKVRFIHLNHSNPVADPASAAARAVRGAGMGVAREGDLYGL